MMNERQRDVALVPCDSYEQETVDAAVACAIELLGGFEKIFSMEIPSSGQLPCSKPITKESALVLKPNLLTKTPPEKACTTHPAVFKAVGRALQKAGYKNLSYGDSPGNPVIKVEKVAEECGIKTAADDLGIPLGEFERGSKIAFPSGRAAANFILCDEILETNGIINICKMKTHQLERITGAVKNIFGCVYGANKAACHAKYATAEVFAKMLADLNLLVAPKLHVMDGIMAMEGNGPQSGTPKAMNVILVSTDPVALDGLFCKLVNLNPELVPTNVTGMEQKIGSYQSIRVITPEGDLTAAEAAARYGDPTFQVQRGKEYKGRLKKVRFLEPFLQMKPVVKEARCVGCGICVKACPVEGKAIHVRHRTGSTASQKNSVARYEYEKCIKCYCCQEMCPEEAITVKKSLLARIADRNWRI